MLCQKNFHKLRIWSLLKYVELVKKYIKSIKYGIVAIIWQFNTTGHREPSSFRSAFGSPNPNYRPQNSKDGMVLLTSYIYPMAIYLLASKHLFCWSIHPMHASLLSCSYCVGKVCLKLIKIKATKVSNS